MGLNDRPVSNVPRSRGLNEAGRGGGVGGGGVKRGNETTKSMTHTKKHRNTSKTPLFLLQRKR